MADGAAPDIRLRDFVHLDRGHDPRLNLQLFERVLQCQCIEDRGDHAHVIGSGAIHPLAAGCQSTPDVAAADDNRRFNAMLDDTFDLPGKPVNDERVDPLRRIPHHRLAAELQEDSSVGLWFHDPSPMWRPRA
jgi:hypothetical protein